MKTNKINNIIVIAIVLLATVASAYGIFSGELISENQVVQTIYNETVQLYGKGLYHNESVSMASQVRAQDMVTLLIAVPFLIYALILNNKQSIKGQFLLTGTLGYFLYTYASLCFVAMYNYLFLLYVALMGLSFFGFVINITSMDTKKIKLHFSKKLPSTYLGYSIIIFGIAISLMWLGRLVPAIFTGMPEGIEHYTTFPIQALDLGIVLPTAILSGIMLIQRKALGYLLAPVIIIKAVTMLLAINAMAISMLINHVNISIMELIVFPLCTVVFCFNLYLIMKNLNSNKEIANK